MLHVVAGRYALVCRTSLSTDLFARPGLSQTVTPRTRSQLRTVRFVHGVHVIGTGAIESLIKWAPRRLPGPDRRGACRTHSRKPDGGSPPLSGETRRACDMACDQVLDLLGRLLVSRCSRAPLYRTRRVDHDYQLTTTRGGAARGRLACRVFLRGRPDCRQSHSPPHVSTSLLAARSRDKTQESSDPPRPSWGGPVVPPSVPRCRRCVTE